MILIVSNIVHQLQEGLLFAKVYCCMDYTLLTTVFSKVALNQQKLLCKEGTGQDKSKFISLLFLEF